ncbi:MAG: hypothetical protein OK454_06800, partial [Thaumarchaeota archaeon]|nr:hypothetical protein [Nitrososphaerota archaeon]
MTSSSTSSDSAALGSTYCEGKAWVSCGGDERPCDCGTTSSGRWKTWLGRPSGGVAVASLKRSLVSSVVRCVTG